MENEWLLAHLEMSDAIEIGLRQYGRDIDRDMVIVKAQVEKLVKWMDSKFYHEQLRDTAVSWNEDGIPVAFSGKPGHWLSDEDWQSLRKEVLEGK